MTAPVISLCRTCQDADPALLPQLAAALREAHPRALLQSVDCMSGCARPQTLSVRQSGKTAYLFGEITAADLPDILRFLRLYEASADGTFTDARPIGELRFKAIARIPAPLPETTAASQTGSAASPEE
ncbi:protein of unknown function DUF1636 [Ruegeria sp. TM1040]|uniref:DUF1636 family protein n=1 Tax=Ruegeria sp. (strain TM1040) TaxID=292414 RepID=UPI0000462ED4|nr:DUF1636 family protein [Ruegeria sp. TM1040]ABF64953.1 protein of unknown function DUF1636 [Ruegeria sp. TM1040]